MLQKIYHQNDICHFYWLIIWKQFEMSKQFCIYAKKTVLKASQSKLLLNQAHIYRICWFVITPKTQHQLPLRKIT